MWQRLKKRRGCSVRVLHFNKRENRELVVKALRKADRDDLIPVLAGKTGKPGKTEHRRKDRRR